MDIETLVCGGSTLKRLPNGKYGAHLVLFTTKTDPDLTNDFFTADTDFDFEDGDSRTMYYNHGLDAKVGNRKIGKAVLSKDDIGVWMEAQFDERDEYAKAVKELADAGALGVSSGALSHLVRRQKATKTVNWVSHWPIGEASPTPTPAEPRTLIMPIKTWAESLKGDALGKYADDSMGAEMAMAGIHSLNNSLASHVASHVYNYSGETKTPDEKIAAIHAGVREHSKTARKMISACLGGKNDEAKAVLESAFTDFADDTEEVPTVKTVASIATIRDFEEFLREAGYSKKDATGIALHGYNSRRDAGDEEPITPETATPPMIDAEAQQSREMKLMQLALRTEGLRRAYA